MATRRLSGVLQHLRQAALRRDGGGLTDGELLGTFLAQRDEAAFEALVRRHGPMVLGVCRRILQHVQDAEDAFQATFLVLARKAATIVPREMVGNWLYGVAYRTAREAQRAAARRRAHEKQVKEMPHPPMEPEEAWPELRPLLDQELSRLPDKYRIPVVLCDLEGRTRKEVARQLQVPEGTLSNRLATARKRLAQRLARHGLTLSAGALAAVLSQPGASAGMPTALVVSTVQAAASVAAGQAVTAGVISAKVAALTEGVLKTMLLTKLHVATAVLLALSVTATSASLLFPPAQAEKPAEPKQEKRLSTAPAKVGQPEAKGTWRERASLLTQAGEGHALAFAPDGKALAVGGSRLGKAELWDVTTGKIRTTVIGQPGRERMGVDSVAFSPDGQLLALAGGEWGESGSTQSEGWMKLYDVAAGELLDIEHGHTNRIRSVVFSPDGKTLATGSLDFTVKLHDVATRKVRATLRGHVSSVNRIAFSPDGTLVASPSLDGTVRLWDVATAKEKATFGGPTDGTGPLFVCVAFSPDGKTLAAGTWSTPIGPCDVHLLEVATGQERGRLQGHTNWIEAVAFAPDGKTLASTGADKMVRLWEVATGRELASLTGHQGHLLAVAFSCDGKLLASGGHEQTVKLWEWKK